MKTDQMQTRARHQCGQALHEFQRQHPDVRGAVAPRAFELQHDLPRFIALESLVGDRGARDVAAQAFELLALVRATAHRGESSPPHRHSSCKTSTPCGTSRAIQYLFFLINPDLLTQHPLQAHFTFGMDWQRVTR